MSMRRTAKGEMVDFDLIKAKQQMVDKPAPKEVSSRQEVIDRRLRKKAAAQMAPSVLNTKPEPKPAPPVVKEVIKKESIVEKEELEETVEDVMDDEEDEISSDESDKPRRRQRTKPKTTN